MDQSNVIALSAACKGNTGLLHGTESALVHCENIRVEKKEDIFTVVDDGRMNDDGRRLPVQTRWTRRPDRPLRTRVSLREENRDLSM